MSTHLAAGRHLHPWIQSMRTAAYEVSKFVLRSTTQVRTKRNPDIASLRAWMLLDHSLHTHFPISIHNTDTAPCQRRSKIRHRSSHSRTKHRQAESDVATLHACQCCTMSKDEAESDIATFPCTDQQRQTRSKTEQNQRHNSPYMNQTC